MNQGAIKNKIAVFAVGSLIYAASLFIGVGVFSLMNYNGVFVSSGTMEIYLYLVIASLTSLFTCAVLSLSFRNLSFLKCFPGVVGPLAYCSLVLYFRVFKAETLILFVAMWIYAVYIFIRGLLPIKDVSTPDRKFAYVMEKNPRTYIFIYIGLGILIPTILAFLAFVPSFRYVQNAYIDSTVSFSGWEIAGLVCVFVGLAFSIANDIPLLCHKVRGRKGKFAKGLWKRFSHPNIFGDIFVYLGVCLYGCRNENSWFFVFASIALFVYVFVLILPYLKKADSFLEEEGER